VSTVDGAAAGAPRRWDAALLGDQSMMDRAKMNRRQLLRGVAGAAVLGALGRAVGGPAVGWAAQDPSPLALDVVSRTIEIGGKPAKVYGLLNASGGQGLGFKVGDAFRVRLNNRLAEPTLVHWHGLKPPSAQDGVPGLSQDPIAAGASFDYDFPLATPGTYWMHSHFSLRQVQRLLSAPLIIRTPEDLARDEQEVVVMLNDFTFRDPDEVLASLRGGAGASASAGGAMNMSGMSAAMGKMPMGGMQMGGMQMGSMPMEKSAPTAKAGGQGAASSRMDGMADVNDIDFDAYLANDRTLADPTVVRIEAGGAVRLRIINGADSTNFMLDVGTVEGELIAVDGQPIQPIRGRSFPIAMAQRLDIRLRLPAGEGAYPILAAREDDTIRTGIVLATKRGQISRIAERSAKKASIVGLELETQLRPLEPLAVRPVQRTRTVLLGGDMQRYVWTMDGAVYGQNKPIEVATGERVELVMENTTGMAHPMHLHGTVFQVVAIGGQRFNGARRDTVMVPPNGNVTIAFDADNPGRWAFHCHNAYHQEAGMMSSVEYI
jgi:FtsP/CotA-like multicopper oxidase with cupredoxin domain